MTLNSDLNKRISDLQLQVLRGDNEQDTFSRMLELIIDTGESEFGFVAELVESSQGNERLKIRAITNIATTKEMIAMHTDFVKGEKFFESGPNLIGEVLRTHEKVVSNDVLNDKRSGQLPKDHQRIKRFIGLPLLHDTTMVGMIGLANRRMPYDESFVKLLEPLLVTCTTLLVVYRERSQRKEKEIILAEMRHNIDLMAAAFRFAQDGMIITDKNGNIIEVNESFCRDSGYSRDLLIGKNPRILRSGRQPDSFYQEMWQKLAQSGHWKGELWNIRRTGEEYAVGLTISAILNETSDPQNYVGVSTNITQAKKHEEKLAWLVFHDEKTGFPNLRFIIKNLSEQISSLNINELLCIAYIDIDKFKLINDRFGPYFGDLILKRVGNTLTELLSVDEVFARLNGDEFVLSFKKKCPKEIHKRLEIIKKKITMVCSQDISHVFTVSIGVTLYPQLLIRDSEQLIRQADQAMYTAKLMGGDQIQYFDLLEEKEKTSFHQLINEIRHAIEHDEFILFYQPKINTNTYEIIGAEALIRWQHPARGLLSPAAFLPLVEHDDIIEAIGIWVLNACLDQLTHWLKSANTIPLSINISPRELHSVDFLSNVISALKHYQHVDPSLLEFEVLETSALEDIDYVSRVIMECRKLGIEFAIDDFGTGYSSLTYLKHLPVDIIKIDQSFIRNITHNSVDQAILKSIIDLANILNRKLIAEGIETQQHLELLKEMGCDFGQGYAIGRPMPIDEFEEWSRKWMIKHG